MTRWKHLFISSLVNWTRTCCCVFLFILSMGERAWFFLKEVFLNFFLSFQFLITLFYSFKMLPLIKVFHILNLHCFVAIELLWLYYRYILLRWKYFSTEILSAYHIWCWDWSVLNNSNLVSFVNCMLRTSESTTFCPLFTYWSVTQIALLTVRVCPFLALCRLCCRF